MTDLFSIAAAQGDPFILVTGTGLWSPGDVERHFRALDKELRAMRARPARLACWSISAMRRCRRPRPLRS